MAAGGSQECRPSTITGTGVQPQFPAASPYVTSVGATGLTPSTIQYDLTKTPRSSVCTMLARNYVDFSYVQPLDAQVHVLSTVTSWLSKEAPLRVPLVCYLGPFLLCLLMFA